MSRLLRACFFVTLFLGGAVYAAPDQMAVLTGTETTAITLPNDLNQTTPFAIKWSASNFDSTYFDHSTSSFSHQVKVKISGDYRLSFTMPLFLADPSGARRSIIGEIYINGSPIETGRMASSYMRQSGGHNESSLHTVVFLENLNANDNITIYVNQGTSQTGEVTTPSAQLFLEYIDSSRTVFVGTGDRTTNSTNFNQATSYSVEWDSGVKDTGFTHSDSTSPEQITLDTAGDYLVFVNIPFESSGCGNRNSPKTFVRLDGATVTGGVASQGYIRCLDTHEESSVHWAGLLSGVSAGQILTVNTQSETSNSTAMAVPSGRKASIFVERVDTTNDYISLTGTTLLSGSDWNPSPNSEVQWSSQSLIDATTYSHSTSVNSHKVTVDVDGSYFLIYNDHLTSTVQRANPKTRILVNNSAVSSGQCATHYIRSQENHNESSCSLTHFLADLQAGDEISVEQMLEAAGGTVNDASPARLSLIRVADADPPSCDGVVECTPDLVLHVDGNTYSSVLDGSSRNANDVSFSGTVATWEDISGSTNTHDLTQTSAASRPSFDTTTGALSFDGVNDYFDIANSDDLNTATSLKERTIVVAFNTGSDVTSRQVIYEEGGTVRGMNVYIRGGNLYIGFWNINNDGDGSQPFTSASTPVSANTNYYASLVIDYSNYTGGGGPDGQLRGHINGVEFPSLGTTTSLLYAHAGAIGMGGMRNDTYFDDGAAGGNGNYFQGDIYEMFIYNHAIDNTEAVEFYNYLRDKWPDPFPMTNVSLDSQYTNDNTETPNITWTASVSPDINRYELALGSAPGGTDVSTWTSVGTNTNGAVTGLSLSECVDYYATVRAVDDDSNISPAENTEFIRFDGTDPTDPSSLVISGASSTTTSKLLSWSASTDGCAFSHYEAAIGTTPGDQDAVAWTDIGNVISHQFTGITPALSTSTDYYTSIRAYDEAGNISAVVTSAAWQVDTCVASDVTAPTDPGSFTSSGDAGGTSSPDHSWSASTDGCGFSHYELSIGTSAGATNVVNWTNVGDVLSYKFFGISPALSTNTNYFTNIQAVDLAGNTSGLVSTSAWQLPLPGGVSSGLVLWLDSGDGSTVFSNAGCSTLATNGGTVACWADKSSSGNNATAAGGARPTWQDNQFNAQGVIRFDGNNDALDFSNINDIRTVFVVNKSDGTTYQQFLGHTTSRDFYTANEVLIGPTISSSSLRTGSWRVDQVPASSPTIFTQTGSYSMISVVTDGDVEANHIASDRKTGGRFFEGDIAELIVYDRPLTAQEVSDVESYLNSKWFSVNPEPVTSLAFQESYTAVSNQSPVFGWTHSPAADLDHYEVALGTAAGTNDIAGWTNIGLVNVHQFFGLSLPECTDFFASVRAVDTDGYSSSVSSTSFGRFDSTAPTAASGLVVSGVATETASKTLNWTAGSDACSLSHYEVALGTTSGGNDVVDWMDVGDVLSHQITGIAPNLSFATDYYISVKAVDSAGNESSVESSSAWQLDTCVQTDVVDPTDPSSLTLSGNATVTESRTLSWSPSSDACAFSHYQLGIGTSSGAVDVVGFQDIGDVNTYRFTELGSNLSYGQNYFLTLQAVDEAGNTSNPVSSAAWTLNQPGDVSVAGLSLWLDTSDAETLYQDDSCSVAATSSGQSIGCIKDKSGVDNHATNSTPSNKPELQTASFNSQTSVYFDGATDRFLDFGSQANIRTVFWVLKEDVSNPGNTAFLLGDPGGSSSDFARDSTLGNIFSSGNASASVLAGTLKKNGLSINGTTTPMPSSETVLSLVTTGNVTASSFSRDRTSCCGSRTWGGSLAEIIVFTRALSGAEVIDVENYLMSKWGISAGVTQWTGAVGTDWFDAGNWNNGLPTANRDCLIDDEANDPVIASGTAVCRNVNIGSGFVTLSNGTGATLQVFGNYSNTGTLVQNDGVLEMADDGNVATDQTIITSSAIEALSFSKSAGGSVSLVTSSVTINDLTISSGNSFQFNVSSGKTLVLPNGMSMDSATFDVAGGGEVQVGSGQSISVTGGVFSTSGTNDTYPQSTSNKALLTRYGGGRWSFSATAGQVSLTGFLLDYLDSAGLSLSGSAVLAKLDGGQFTNLNQDWVTPVSAIQLNTSSSLADTTATNIGFNWGAANSLHSGTPDPTDNYYLVNAPDCNNSTLIFDQWYGDFVAGTYTPLTEDKILDSDDGGNSCQISMTVAASPVSLVAFDGFPYDESAVLIWETGAEVDHLGFNVLRSNSMYSGYVQVNHAMILNFNNSTVFRGDYYFLDENLNNDQTYYYMIEDVSINGAVERHGPIAVTPKASGGGPPAEDPEDNTTPNAPPVSVDLGGGVSVVTQTANSIRLEIIPGALDIQDASWDSSYKDVFIPGYSKMLDAGHPELLERKILIAVPNAYSSTETIELLLDTSDVSASLSGKKISPAPLWSLNASDVLVPSYAEDATAYSDTNYSPSLYYEVSQETVEISGRYYVEIKVWPLKYQANGGGLERLDRVVLDIGLNGAAWDVAPPAASFPISPASVEGGVRIKYAKPGFYELNFDDLESSQIEGPLAGVSVNNLRLYYHGQERPLDIIDSDGVFNSGDRIRYYAPYAVNVEDDLDEVVLTQFDLGQVEYSPGDDPGPLRFEETDNQPSASPIAAKEEHYIQAVAEENNTPIFDRPMGDIVDRFYWKRIYTLNSAGPDANSRLDFSVNLAGLNSNSSWPVLIQVHVRGRGVFSQNPTHHLGVQINAEGVLGDSRKFTGSEPQVINFSFDATRFSNGQNDLRLEVIGDLVESSDYDLVDINKVVIEYPSLVVAQGGALHLTHLQAHEQVVASGFSSANIHVYDLSDPLSGMKYQNFAVDEVATGNWMLQFDSIPGLYGTGGKEIFVVEDGAFLAPTSMGLARGVGQGLRSPSHRGDYLIVGPEELLEAAVELADYRDSQGLTSFMVSMDEVQAEFSHGRRSSYALRDFIEYANSHWALPPKYLLILGDGTYDPNDYLGLGYQGALLPVPIQKGQHTDFGSDNFYVEFGGTHLPNLAVGRLPADRPEEVQAYIEKVMDYESGERSPEGSMAKSASFISGGDLNNEDFDVEVERLSSSLLQSEKNFNSKLVRRVDFASDADAKVAINEDFADPGLLMTFLGHGAKDLWGSSSLYTLNDVQALENNKLPIVTALNCLNAYFYDPDEGEKSLGEELIFNPDGGAIAFWGSTSMTSPVSQSNLATSFYSELAKETTKAPSTVRLGDLQLRAKHAQGESLAAMDTVRSWSLFGDPALKLPQGSFSGQAASVTPGSSRRSTGGCLANASVGESSAELTWVDLVRELMFFILVVLVWALLRFRALPWAE